MPLIYQQSVLGSLSKCVGGFHHPVNLIYLANNDNNKDNSNNENNLSKVRFLDLALFFSLASCRYLLPLSLSLPYFAAQIN